jgi:hypothetical protein
MVVLPMVHRLSLVMVPALVCRCLLSSTVQSTSVATSLALPRSLPSRKSRSEKQRSHSSRCSLVTVIAVILSCLLGIIAENEPQQSCPPVQMNPMYHLTHHTMLHQMTMIRSRRRLLLPNCSFAELLQTLAL